MPDKPTSRDDSATGVGPGITGASGDFIDGTGGDRGVGGTGEDRDAAAAGARPDERNNPSPQELGNARPDGVDAMSETPGGPRNVGPANDRDTSGAKGHLGSDRAEPQEQDLEGPREGGRDR
jgi:hypothetical protein